MSSAAKRQELECGDRVSVHGMTGTVKYAENGHVAVWMDHDGSGVPNGWNESDVERIEE